MNLFDSFQQGHAYGAFLDKYGHGSHKQRWASVYDQVKVTADQSALLKSFVRKMNVLCLAGAWCGDCVNQCPIFQHFAELAPVIDLRFIDRDEHAPVQQALQVNGGNRVPVVVFFSEDGFEVARFGDRPLSTYRRMAASQIGPSCMTGIQVPGDNLLSLVTQDWLNEFERAQWILRLSGRLRTMHND
ncbi:MAG: thioredoxin family protein [Gemmataceae bacterium]|nr:thioredoxin family protein [Gemmataceae bacterium]